MLLITLVPLTDISVIMTENVKKFFVNSTQFLNWGKTQASLLHYKK